MRALDGRRWCPHLWLMNWLYWAILSAVFAGVTAVLAKQGVENVNSHLATAIRTTVVLLFTWGIAAATVPLQGITELSRRNWLFLSLSGIATGLSWLCYFRAIQLGEFSRVAPIDKLSVVFAIILSILFLRERFTLVQWAGAGLIVAGVILVAWKKGPA
jgi:bacterial/archaeal transporter family protein